jgi:hypothetical protein
MSNNQIMNIFSPMALQRAFDHYTHSTQREAKHYPQIQAYQEDLEGALEYLSSQMLAGNLYPSPAEVTRIPKPNGSERHITVLALPDALIYQAIADYCADVLTNVDWPNENVCSAILNPIAEVAAPCSPVGGFFFESYLVGFKRFEIGFLKAKEAHPDGYVLVADISKFFDSVAVDLVVDICRDLKLPEVAIEWLRRALPIWSTGLPQGQAPSHLFASLALRKMDEHLAASGLDWARFVDDIRVYHPSREKLGKLRCELRTVLSGLGLALNVEKTKVIRIEEAHKQGLGFAGSYFCRKDELGLERLDFKETLVGREEQLEFAAALLLESSTTIEDLVNAYREPNPNNRQSLIIKLAKRTLPLAGHQIRAAFSIRRKWGVCVATSVQLSALGEAWVELLPKRFWQANHICWVLAELGELSSINSRLLKALKGLRKYEWCERQILSCFSDSFQVDEQNLMLSPVETSGFEFTWYRQITYRWLRKRNAVCNSHWGNGNMYQGPPLISVLSLVQEKKELRPEQVMLMTADMSPPVIRCVASRMDRFQHQPHHDSAFEGLMWVLNIDYNDRLEIMDNLCAQFLKKDIEPLAELCLEAFVETGSTPVNHIGFRGVKRGNLRPFLQNLLEITWLIIEKAACVDLVETQPLEALLDETLHVFVNPTKGHLAVKKLNEWRLFRQAVDWAQNTFSNGISNAFSSRSQEDYVPLRLSIEFKPTRDFSPTNNEYFSEISGLEEGSKLDLWVETHLS